LRAGASQVLLFTPSCSASAPVYVAPAAHFSAGTELAIALAASAFAIVLGLAVAPLFHRLWLARSSSQVRERRLAQSLDKAAKSVQQRHIAEHGQRNARIDEWLSTQDLPRAMPALRPLAPGLFAAPAADSFRRETVMKKSSDLEQQKSTEMAIKIGSLPHTQWHVQRGGSFSSRDASATQSTLQRGGSFSSRDESAPQSPALRSGVAPSLPPYPSHLPPLHKK